MELELPLSPTELAFRDELRRFCATLPRERYRGPDEDQRLEEGRRWAKRLHQGGWAVPAWPRRYGGREASPVEMWIYEHEMAAVHPPRDVTVIGRNWAAAALLGHGSDAQRDRYLPAIPGADEIWCQLFSEPGAGSDLASLTTRARRLDDGSYRVTGQKLWSSLAHVSRRGLLLARTSTEEPRHRGLSCFVVDMAAAGVTVRRLRQMTGDADFCEVFLDDVAVAAEDRIGAEGAGWEVAITTLLAERVALSAGEGTLWGTGPTFDDVLGLWRRRRDAGLVGDAQRTAVLRDRLVQLYVEGLAIRLTGLRLLQAVAAGRTPLTEMSVRKLAADLWGQEVHDAVQEILGPDALLDADDPRAPDDGTWQRAALFARALTIGGGTAEVQRSILARRVLGLPLEA